MVGSGVIARVPGVPVYRNKLQCAAVGVEPRNNPQSHRGFVETPVTDSRGATRSPPLTKGHPDGNPERRTLPPCRPRGRSPRAVAAPPVRHGRQGGRRAIAVSGAAEL